LQRHAGPGLALTNQDVEQSSHEFELTAPPMGLRELLWTDYEAALVDRDESLTRSRLLWPLRVLINPSLLFALTVRLAQKGPVWLLYPLRIIQVMCFSSEIHGFKGDDAIEIGPGITFPHPIGIIIGRGTKIGAGVTIYNNTNIGANRHLPQGDLVQTRAAAQLGDRSVIYAYSAIQGPFDVGHDAVVGIHVVLDEDVPPGALKTNRKLRLAGEWPGEKRTHWRPPSESA
jgi:serine O-acetyltransferase